MEPRGQQVAVLVHGWPDCPEGWEPVAERTAAVLSRALPDAARLRPDTPRRADPRSGQLTALGRDLLDFIDALRLDQPVLVGHDWGARAVANACGLRHHAAARLVMLAVGYGTNDPNQHISLSQTRNYWYHWYMATPRGEQTVVEDRAAFTRLLGYRSPAGWYAEADFVQALEAFDNPDWAAVVLHSYRHRWGFVDGDPAYASDEALLQPAPVLAVPTLVLHGEADTCNAPETSAGREVVQRPIPPTAIAGRRPLPSARGATGSSRGDPTVLSGD